MTTQWTYIRNTFDSVTKTSNKKMLSIGADTLAKLQNNSSDPDIMSMFNDLTPVWNSYVAIHGNWEAASGIRESKTITIEDLMKDTMPLELRKWEGVVRAVYVEDSPQEHAIFPNKRVPFLSGTYEQRIYAIVGLIAALEDDGSFPALVVTVQSFYNIILSARNLQQQKEGAVDQQADLRENQRVLLAQTLHGILGRLIHKFRADIIQVERFFDLTLLRSHDSFPATSIEVHGQVTVGGTGEPVVGATVTIGKVNNPEPEVVITDAEGRYKVIGKKLNQSDEGEVRLTVNAPGFQFFEFFFNVELGEIYDINPSLNQAMLKAA